MELKINGVELTAYPSSFSVDIMDLDSAEGSGRTADGYGYRDRVRAGVRKISMTWGPLRWDEISAILQAFQDEYFDVTYPDPMSGQYETRTFNVGDRSAPFAVSRDGEIIWTGLKFNLVER